jgi:hypothetical protein
MATADGKGRQSMNRWEWIAPLLVFIVAVTSAAGSLDAATNQAGGDEAAAILPAPIQATLCQLGIAPERFQGKVVEVRAIVQTGLETSLLRDDGCSTFIWLSGIDSAQTARKDRQYQKMLEYLDKKYKPKDGSVCARCPLYKVTATVVGRFEHIGKSTLDPKTDPPTGFGYLNSYESQLVLQGVSNVLAEPIDRSASEKHK